MMPGFTEVFRREAKGEGYREFGEGVHLMIEPALRLRTERVCPAQAGS